jgi:hypothetical protein
MKRNTSIIFIATFVVAVACNKDKTPMPNTPTFVACDPNKVYYEEYLGPIYYYGTNRIAEKPKKVGTTFLNDVDPRDAKRPRNQEGF